MAVTTTNINKPINPRGDDKSPLAFNRAKIYSGKALDFDGVNDYVNLDGFTLSGTTATFVFNFNTDVLSVFRYLFDISDNRFIIGFGDTSGVIQLYDGAFKNIFTPTIGEWYNLIISIDGTTANCYVNGVLETTLSITAIDLSSATQSALGANRDKGGSFWQGYVSGTRIFNTALTAAQVLDLYNNPEKIVPTGVDNTALKLWLPMMEGAGTTAYDGSGNGNHGTISGATWTHGVGAPVAQTAVIDWNKGQNIFTYSEDFTQWGNARTIDTANATTAPDGSNNAIKLEQESGQTNAGSIYLAVTLSGGNDYQISVFAKAEEKNFVVLYDSNANRTFFDVANGEVGTNNSGGTATIEPFANDWYKCTITYTEPSTGNANVGYYLADTDNNTTVTDSGGLYLWGPSIALEGKNNSYLPTYGTIQNSDVLLPQGLTSGYDITGVNQFENVRKQYALNLDGQSWAEIHDNESLDFGTGEFTMEVWVNGAFVNVGSSFNGILTLGGDAATAPSSSAGIYSRSANYYFAINLNGINFSTIDLDTWTHLVVTRNSSNLISTYYNGVLDTTATYADSVTNALNPQIGRDSNSSRYYQDQIAQPRIYNRALTADEVEQNYNAGKNTYS